MWKVSRREMNRDSSDSYAKCNMRLNFADATRRFRFENNSSRERQTDWNLELVSIARVRAFKGSGKSGP